MAAARPAAAANAPQLTPRQHQLRAAWYQGQIAGRQQAMRQATDRGLRIGFAVGACTTVCAAGLLLAVVTGLGWL